MKKDGVQEEKADEKSNNKFTLFFGGVILLAVITFSVSMNFGGKDSFRSDKKEVIQGLFDQEGKMYFVEEDGTVVEVNGSGHLEGYLTRDRSKIIVLDEGNTLYVTDVKGEKKTEIPGQVNKVEAVRDSGLIYSTEGDEIEPEYDEVLQAIADENEEGTTKEQIEETIEEYGFSSSTEVALELYKNVIGKEYKKEKETVNYRFSFKTGESVRLGTGAFTVSENSLHILFEEKNDVYLLKEREEEREKFRSYDDGSQVDLAGIDDGAKFAVWAVEDGEKGSLYVGENESSVKIDTFEIEGDQSESSNMYIPYFSKQDEGFVLVNQRNSKIYMKKSGKEPQVMEVGEQYKYIHIFDGSGFSFYHTDQNAFCMDDFYFAASEGLGDDYDFVYDLYYADAEGKQEKVLEGAKDLYYSEKGYLFYIEDGGSLLSAVLNGEKLEEENNITSGVGQLKVAPDGESVYFTEDLDESAKGDLYYAGVNGEKEKIRAGALSYGFYPLEGGGIAYLVAEPDERKSEAVYGTMVVRDDSGKETEIAGDVLANREGIGDLKYQKGFVYKVLGDELEDGEYLYDCRYFDGEDSLEVLKNIK